MTTVDLRGFTYPLQALVQRKQWQVDERLRELSAALHRLETATKEHASVSAACENHAARIRRAWRDRTDPVAQQRLLAYLAQQQAKKAQLATEIEKLRLELAQAREHYITRQQELDGLQHDRSSCLDEYAAAERTRELVQADQDWVARAHWRRNGMKGNA